VSGPVLEAVDLNKTYLKNRSWLSRRRGGNEPVYAVKGVSFDLRPGETLAVVGESGAGKSSVGRLVLGLSRPDSGTVTFDGTDLSTVGARHLRALRPGMQMIFQDPYSSLDPRMTVGSSVVEPLIVHSDLSRRDREARAVRLLHRVGLGSGHLEKYPWEMSGGQLQRAAIARALTTDPKLIVCDEPVAALDLSIRAQVLRLLRDLQRETGVAYLFISHDLSLVRLIADRVAVMNAGEIVEQGTVEEIFQNPRQEYTKTLLRAIPSFDPRKRHLLAGVAPG